MENKLTDFAISVMEKRYLLKDKDGNIIETPDEMFTRVAEYVGNDAGEREIFYEMMRDGVFMPSSPVLMNAGTDNPALAACYYMMIEDDMENIFQTIKDMSRIFKLGGGLGVNFSNIRPDGAAVSSTGGTGSGPISFMKVFNTATDVVKQAGKRRGALMGLLRIDHPDIEAFIDCKKDLTQFNNFNISIIITDEFMEAVKNDREIELKHPKSKTIKKIKARELFEKITENAWETGEPGILFIDEANRHNTLSHKGDITGCNACGEIVMLHNELCCLGSIDVSKFYDGFSKKYNWEALEKVVYNSVTFLDTVIDKNMYPLKAIEEVSKGGRKIGLGIMGFADLLYKEGVPYNSNEALLYADKLMESVQDAADECSLCLGREKGIYPYYDNDSGQPPYRNATRTTIAPTGTISIFADCSGGMEPVFSLVQTSTRMDGQKNVIVNKIFEKTARDNGFWSEELLRKLSQGAKIKNLKEIPDQFKKVFVTALDIAPEWHIRMQATFQKHINNSISKTIGMPKSATVEDVQKAYLMAYELKLKGMTVYRDGSRENQVLQVGDVKEKKDPITPTIQPTETMLKPRKRPDITTGISRKLRTGCGNMIVTVNNDGDGLCEIIVNSGKNGGCVSAMTGTIGRLMSVGLRAGVDPKQIIKQLKGVQCPQPTFIKGGRILSCSDGIAKVLEDYLSKNAEYSKLIIKEHGGGCPDCGASLTNTEGCVKCPDCGYTKC